MQEKSLGLRLLFRCLWMDARLTRAALLLILTGICGSLALRAQVGPPRPPPPGRPGPPGPPGPERDPRRLQQRIADVRRGLAQVQSQDPIEREIASFGMTYLDCSEQGLKNRQLFIADRMLGAADAFRHVLEHLNHIRQGPSKPPPTPPPQAISDHLRRVYFRLRLSDFFLQQIPNPKPERLPFLARHFYQLALQAYQASNWLAADEYTKCADDITHALENLAQAAIPEPAVQRVR
jgi:hypothetical protein